MNDLQKGGNERKAKGR